MDENEAVAEQQLATPIFNVYRRGYDPEQVDRYVADQQRRLDDALRRASESERRLAAAVGQLRELHRRVAVYESETRTTQPPSLDTLGERVQRILQEAWEGAYTLRQEAEREVNELREAAAEEVTELREVASREAADVVDQATRRALAIRDETERRRHAYLQRVEQDRERAVSQITYLYDQRQNAISELARLQTTVQAVVEEMARSPLGRPAPGVAVAAASPAAKDGSPTLPSESDMGLRPDRAPNRSGAPRAFGVFRSNGGRRFTAPLSVQGDTVSPLVEPSRPSTRGGDATEAVEQLLPLRRAGRRASLKRTSARKGCRRRPALQADAPACSMPSKRAGPESRATCGIQRPGWQFAGVVKSMGATSTESGDAEEELLSRLRSAGDRVTTPRRLLVRCLFEASGHRTAEELAAAIQARAPDVSISTVYRNLEELERLGAVVHSHLGHGPATYHLATAAHGHLVCRRCGAEVEIEDELLVELRTTGKHRLPVCDRPTTFCSDGALRCVPGGNAGDRRSHG